MTTIIEHIYEDDELLFLIKTGQKKKWVKGETITDYSIVQKYWEDLSKKTAEKEDQSLFDLAQSTIPPPSSILELVSIDDVSHALCKFDTFDTPVYVPTRFLRNAYPSILIHFFESQIIEDPTRFSKSD